MAREWIPLFSPDLPAKVAISRPQARTITTRRFEDSVRDDVARKARTKEPVLCFNADCPNELRTLPQAFAFLKTTDDPKAPPIAMGVCDECARKLDDHAIRAIMRKTFSRFGLDGTKAKHVKVEWDVSSAFMIDAGPALQIAVAAADVSSGDQVCDAAQGLASLLLDRKLPRFIAFRGGAHNCHALVDALYLDLRDIGAAHLFSFKSGSSEILKSDADPEGLHSWVEIDGWTIDASGGALGNPIMMLPVEDFYAQWRLTNIRDIEGKSIPPA